MKTKNVFETTDTEACQVCYCNQGYIMFYTHNIHTGMPHNPYQWIRLSMVLRLHTPITYLLRPQTHLPLPLLPLKEQ